MGEATTTCPVVLLSAVAGLQVYVVAPPAVKVLGAPGQVNGNAALAVTVGTPFTFIIAVVESMHPKTEVPTIWYVVVAAGVAVTVAPVDVFKVPAGCQVYVEAPLAVSVIELPRQMVLLFDGQTDKFGRGFTVTYTASLSLQLKRLVPVTEKLPEIVGTA